MTMRALSWHQRNTFHHRQFGSASALAARLRAAEMGPVSVCLPARNEVRTIGPILSCLRELRELGLIDQIVVVDDSVDGTAEVARQLGAEVHAQRELRPELGEVLGKGDALWRALPVLRGEIVCFLDADSEHFGPHFVTGLLGPLVDDPRVAFVKAHYRRPFRFGELTLPDEGGRVTELTARPLLNLFYPDLAGFEQPLAGEVAMRRTLLERLPFATGYGVDIALLIDAYAAVGLDGLAQVNLDLRQNAHQPLRELAGMASAVLGAVALRLEREGRLHGPLPSGLLIPETDDLRVQSVSATERPPLREARAAA
ncbi:MAG TPA: glucosyl-3-phosphoglycerate synthase [Solirubrobacteraceae bacterium]|nr:glucosyl-3-phosphoglycerate synthase [Solirubrobacteraceae bacterium]